MYKIAPSILATDPLLLGASLSLLEGSSASLVHIDVMDGNFVPPISFGESTVDAVRRGSTLFREVHLMVERPADRLDSFAQAGSQRLIIHVEADKHAARTLQRIRECGMSPGIALNPGTPSTSIFDLLYLCDVVLVMTVNPGWGGQKFISHTLQKIQAVKQEIVKNKLSCEIEVDGGITLDTIGMCAKAGATIFVAGTSVFGKLEVKETPQTRIEQLISSAKA